MWLSVLWGAVESQKRTRGFRLAAVSALFSRQQFYGFGKALSEKPMTKSMVRCLALAVPVPFVSPDGQAVVPLPAVFISGAGKLLAPSLQKRNKVGLVGAVYLFLGVIHS
ncbi:MAG: hypothetical protein ACLRZ9_13140 [Eubacterium sp.]